MEPAANNNNICEDHHLPSPASTNTTFRQHQYLPTPPSAITSICQHHHLPASTSARINIYQHHHLPTSTSANTTICQHQHPASIHQQVACGVFHVTNDINDLIHPALYFFFFNDGYPGFSYLCSGLECFNYLEITERKTKDSVARLSLQFIF